MTVSFNESGNFSSRAVLQAALSEILHGDRSYELSLLSALLVCSSIYRCLHIEPNGFLLT